jgi:hypothetical protein
MIAKFEYKCRRCGEIDASLATSAKRGLGVLVQSILGVHQEAMAPRLLDSHCCKDGGMGVTDLIGYRVVEEL